MTTDEERRRITERARIELAAATARSDAERARRRAGGEPGLRISSTKGRLQSGAPKFARPTPAGTVEWYEPRPEELLATPVAPGDRDDVGNTTEAAWERRRAVAQAAADLWRAAPGADLVAGDARVARTPDGFVVELPDGSRQWRDDAWALHREGVPAVERPDGRSSWWRHGVLHREDGPAVEGPRSEWWLDGRRHRADGPAAEGGGAPTEWWLDGERHRTDGPAVVWPDGTREWWAHGRRHRPDGPAVEKVEGDLEWWVDGQLHREGGPAMISGTGRREWRRRGVKHRTDGPALEGPGVDPAWAYWVDGERVTRDDVEGRRSWSGRRMQ